MPSAWPGTYIPNLSDWQEGDLVLVEGTGLSGFVIRAAQVITVNLGMLQGAQWSHAAVYVGNGMVVDATYHAGVAEQPLWNYCNKRAITVRRLGDPNTSVEAIRDIARFAKSHVPEPYNVLEAILAKIGIASAQAPNPAALFLQHVRWARRGRGDSGSPLE